MTAGAWRIARITLGCGALLLAPGADAVSLGHAEPRSRLGDPLQARIPLTLGAGEAPRGACFSLLAPPHGPLAAAGARLELRRHAHGADLYVRSRTAINDSPVVFSIAPACPGMPGADPVRYSLTLSAAPPATKAPSAPALPVVTRLPARSGDTLASLAHAIFPGHAQVRRRYVAAIRAENPALASVGDDEPLPEGTAVALPDLRAFAATIPAPRAERRTAMPAPASIPPRAAPKLAQAPPPAPPKPRPTQGKASATAPRMSAAPTRPASPAAHPRRIAGNGGFELRLSAPVMDLSPSKGMDERRRAELRERLLVLEADDRTAAMLEMRENIRRLESQVNALKLKLATLEPTPAPKVEPVAPKALPVAPRTPPPVPKAQPQTKAAVVPPPPPAAVTKSAPAEVARPAAVEKGAPPPAAHPAPAPIAKAAPVAPAKAAPAPARPVGAGEALRTPRAAAEPWYRDRRWLGGLATILVIAWLVLRARVRSSEEPEIIPAPAEEFEPAKETSAIPDTGAPPTTEPREAVIAEELPVATRLPAEDHAQLRRRYMEERFPEIVNGALVLEDERSVVKAARLLYEDGTAPRAVELLQFAIEQDPDALRPWLALFEIFRLEKLTGEFAELAARFRDRHGATDEWRKVRSIGRSLDPGGALYEATEYGAPVDTEAEGWLRSPSDDAGRALAGELRGKLMSQAGVSDADLHADPTPALRKAEIFNVA